jgi:CheY-like chemotaxis protein/two-component sensor histidine kinase
MTGVIDSLPEDELFLNKEKYFPMLKRANSNLLLLINDILDFSKIEADKILLKPRPFEVETMILTLIDDFTHLVDAKGLEISISFDSNIPSIIIGDVVRLKQVLNNLISNAIKFTDYGDIQIILQQENQSSDITEIRFSVIDTGIGIAKEDISSIFDSFTQSRQLKSSKYGGTGLGLAISKQIIELMGGTIKVESEINKGSQFSFTIEFTIPKKQEFDFKKAKTIDETFIIDKPLNILIADDFDDNREIIKLYLKKTRYKIDEAENGLEAVKKYKTHHYDIVFMDLRMPIMDGYAAVREIRLWEEKLSKKTIPIVAITAYGIKHEIEKSLDVGCQLHLTKPFTKEILLKIISSLIN